MKIQPAVRTETVRIAMGTAFFSLVMLLVFALLDRLDVTVVLGTLLGAGAAVLNFFLMALSVQRAAESMKGVTVPIRTPRFSLLCRRCSAPSAGCSCPTQDGCCCWWVWPSWR